MFESFNGSRHRTLPPRRLRFAATQRLLLSAARGGPRRGRVSSGSGSKGSGGGLAKAAKDDSKFWIVLAALAAVGLAATEGRPLRRLGAASSNASCSYLRPIGRVLRGTARPNRSRNSRVGITSCNCWQPRTVSDLGSRAPSIDEALRTAFFLARPNNHRRTAPKSLAS